MSLIKGQRYSMTTFTGYKDGEELKADILRNYGKEPAGIFLKLNENDANNEAFDIDEIVDPVFDVYFEDSNGKEYDGEY